ncbi:MAG: putative glycosyl hydrolase [Verrucomicrobiaceae bacterium]|nr:putative glycosyl hydrolase [Verrucomicrobiaceae bacterium]
MKTLLTVTACLCLTAAHAGERWVYAPANYQVDAQAERIIALMKRAKACGYSHFLLTDSKFARIPSLPKHYFTNAAKVKAAAAETGIEVVPGLFGVGYSNDLLSNDPNLAEGLPVKEALFVVKDFIASHVPEPEVTFRGADLARPKNWGFVDDNLTVDEGGLRSEATDRNARFSQKITVQPFRQYHVSVWTKTRDFSGGIAEIKAIADDRIHLSFTGLNVKGTQDWTQQHITFNSLDHHQAAIYFGVWGGHQGTVGWRKPEIEECGLVNVLRRPGTPLVVKTEDGRILKEGVDYEPVADPRMGTVPYAGEYEPWHEPPNIHVKGIEDGVRLRVSYYHPHIIQAGQVCACVSEPGFDALLKRQAHDVHQLWGAGSYMMGHDEWRVMNWCATCQQRHLTPGEIVAASARDCTSILHAAAPGARVFVWSDMFDPAHNARSGYYLVNGDLAGSWLGLDKDVIVVNWNTGAAVKSLPFFSGLGHRQLIAGYYDQPVDTTRQELEKAQTFPGIIGVMYTTWHNNYDELEAFARMLDAAGF